MTTRTTRRSTHRGGTAPRVGLAFSVLLVGASAALPAPVHAQALSPILATVGLPADEPLDPLFAALQRTLGDSSVAVASVGDSVTGDSVAGEAFADTMALAPADGRIRIARGARRSRPPVVGAARFTSRADSLAWARTMRAAARDDRFRIVVSLFDRRVEVLRGDDTLRSAPAAVAAGDRLAYGGRSWTFNTPRGLHHVLRKEADPLWIPPDWHYAEVARDHGLRLRRLPVRGSVRLADGSRLTVRDRVVGVIPAGSRRFLPLPVDEEVVFDETLFVPPVGTINRRIVGELGRYRLDLGDGYLLHGTPEKESIGNAVTHGCVRLMDEDIEWLYSNVPVGTPVYIY